MADVAINAPLVEEGPPVPPEIAAQVEAYLRKPYHKVISGDADEGFLVQVVELPGCMTAAETEAEAIAQLPEAMTLWLEVMLLDGNPIPEADRDPAYSGRLHVRMPKSLHERLVKQADREGTSLNQWVVSLLSLGAGGAD
ncbi:MAG: toxin-antitoxin system HicB family antitoxin [Dehalococcoidia bacterium]|nr:toxin-antitoxin system HicB family antitoxin [Dehalococcoidia bacterium]